MSKDQAIMEMLSDNGVIKSIPISEHDQEEIKQVLAFQKNFKKGLTNA